MASGGTTLANAYVQIIPSAEGIKGKLQSALGGEAQKAGDNAGKTAGLGFGKKMIAALGALGVGAAVGKFFQSAISAGADLQQSIGGVETLYGKASDAIKGYANEAYKYGLSANDYMEQSTSFAAALKQSLGGDVKAAAEAANTALEDMADNSAKLGTPIESLQTAYQGFAKQNYTMLDNLKLGYGGTKSEMERLLAKAQEITGVEYNIDNLSDVYSAIHVIQEKLDLTGVAAAEASTTFSGSFGAMKAAATNFLGALTTGGDVTGALSGLMTTVSTFLFKNLIPMIGKVIKAIPGAVKTFIKAGLPQLIEGVKGAVISIRDYLVNNKSKILEAVKNAFLGIKNFFAAHKEEIKQVAMTLLTKFITGITEKIPALITKGAEMLDKFLGNIKGNPETAKAGLQVVKKLVLGLLQGAGRIALAVAKLLGVLLKHLLTRGLPALLKAGIRLIKRLAAGIVQAIPVAVGKIPGLIADLISAIAEKFGDLIQAGKDILSNVADGIVAVPGKIVEGIPGLISDIISAFGDGIGDFIQIGKDIVAGIAKGILAAPGALLNAAKSIGQSALGAIKSKLGIASPSKVFAEEVGKWIPAGIAKGILKNEGLVSSALSGLTDPALTTVKGSRVTAANSRAASGGTSTYNFTINGAAGQDPRAIAEEVRKIIVRQEKQRRLAWT